MGSYIRFQMGRRLPFRTGVFDIFLHMQVRKYPILQASYVTLQNSKVILSATEFNMPKIYTPLTV
jgi:hypothetical protein